MTHLAHLYGKPQIFDAKYDRRKSRRITLSVPVMILIEKPIPKGSSLNVGDSLAGVTKNLSAGGLLDDRDNEDGQNEGHSGGLLIETDYDLEPETVCSIEMNLPLPGFIGSFVVAGRVLDSSVVGKKHHSRIAFTRILRHELNSFKLNMVRKMLSV